MFRLSKATDYGIVILAHLARGASGEPREAEPATHNAREVSQEVDLPLPMVSKVMKTLARAGVLASHRGSKGGFRLTCRPEDLSVADMIAALEGPVALTECTAAPSLCIHEGSCAVREPWNVINQAVRGTLSTITLADLVNPGFPSAGSILPILNAPAEAGVRPLGDR